MGKNRKKQVKGKLVIMTSSIIMLNLLGISYANWNDNLDIATSIKTGFIEPYFILDNVEAVDSFEEEAEAELLEGDALGLENANDIAAKKVNEEISINVIDGNTLEISGWCYPGFNKNISVRFGNNGTIPIIYGGIEAAEASEVVNKIKYMGDNIKENDEKALQKAEIIEGNDEQEIKIQIKVDKDNKKDNENKNENEEKQTEHSFEYQIQFDQGIW